MLHPGTEHFLDISAWRSDGEIVPELVLESGIVSDFSPVVFGHRYIIKAMNNMPRAGLD